MSQPADGLRTALADRYRIERELGRGGMATVYLAQDLRHDRPVALKVLHPALAASLGPDRFQREIRLAARLQHPHILTVLDSGAAAEQLWFTMPFVEGESLRDRLVRERQLPVEDAVRFAREAADALGYAHRQGVIHRDVKPENILLSEGHALVADFGIARALTGGQADRGTGGQEETRLTETGMAVGTPTYMSPEQAAGERELDARTDVYALGVVLYEMLAGEPPFTGPTAQAVAARRLTGEAPSVRQHRPSVPAGVEQVVRRAMAAVPADRYASGAELARALGEAAGATPTGVASASTQTVPAQPASRRYRSVALLALGFILGLGVLFGWLRRHDTAELPGGVRRLAVLPFSNLGSPDDEYFADGMTDEVRGRLSGLSGLQVIAHRSAAEYRGTSKSYQEIGRELGVDYLLVGKVRWEKQPGRQSRVRVSPELIEVANSSTKWQQPFDAVLSDVFQVQGRIAGEVARALDLALAPPERERLEVRPTRNLAAYDAFLRGEEHSQRMTDNSPSELELAAGAYERAVALDSTFVPAWARLSQARSLVYSNGMPTPAGLERARAAAERALALDPDAPEARLAMGTFFDFVTGEYDKALEQFALGQRVAPNNADLLSGAALSLLSLGRWEEALAQLTRAESLDPRSLPTVGRLSRTLLWLRRHADAAAAADRAIALEPASIPARQAKVMALLGAGDLDAARAVLRALPSQIEPTEFVAYMGNYWDLPWVLTEEQQALLLRLTPVVFSDDRFGWAHALSQTYAFRGDAARARAYADTAVRASTAVLDADPENGQRRVLLGLALAYAGRSDEAIREGERGAALVPVARDAFQGPYLQHQLARIYIVTGRHEKALDRLEELFSIPYYLSPGWLRVDPTFDPLRKHPRFQALAGTAE
ncbi:MAG TPA: serine/threonine-protein kinase [Gemmatimonadales bacterium]